ncbi:MAG: rhodanese-like domain-containing protein [Bacteroidetes bacterium]|nr:rhodanese-like domain-containing protein [Bacteroidota bacterium]MBK9671929.1 rhodanese-like domain-containing protein [Bacteroidota bacterium]MBK9798487.1 rhodanese-like domain-containing protein [Bacteroidota bacterium]MBP6413700.1 rhodanese-like domain-containing protein [Bacteroidia bacterium]
MELKEILKSPGHTIVDVRPTSEFQKGHIPDSLNIPLKDIPAKLEELKKMSKPLVLCCGSGNDCRHAHIFLSQQGVGNTFAGGSWLELNALKPKPTK